MEPRHWILVLTVAGLFFAFLWFLWLEPDRANTKWYRRIRSDIMELAQKRPPEVNPGEWEFAVGWTTHLLANCGASHTWVNRDEAGPFADELERRLQDPVNLGTIDWIWDEFARITKGGRLYSDKYRPTQSPDREFAQPGCFSISVK